MWESEEGGRGAQLLSSDLISVSVSHVTTRYTSNSIHLGVFAANTQLLRYLVHHVVLPHYLHVLHRCVFYGGGQYRTPDAELRGDHSYELHEDDSFGFGCFDRPIQCQLRFGNGGRCGFNAADAVALLIIPKVRYQRYSVDGVEGIKKKGRR